MKVISIITIIAAMLYLYLTVATLRSNQRSLSTWLLAASSFCLMYWTFLAYFTYNAKDIEQLRLLFQISLTGLFLFLPLQLFFIRSLKNRLSLKFILLAAVPAIILLVKNFGWDITFTDFYRENGIWVFVPATGLWNSLWKLYITISFGSSLVILLRWYKKTELNREKKQIKLLLVSSTVTMILTLGEYLLYPFFSHYWTVSLSPILLLPWVSGYVLAISRYQFLNITPENITRHILESVDELVVLIDFNGKPSYLNKKAKSFFRKKINQNEKFNFNMLFNPESEENLILRAGVDSISLKKKLVLTTSGTNVNLPILNIELTKIFDKFNDPLGYLLIANETDTQTDIVKKYKLTAREVEVLGAVVNGLKTRIIAEKMKITERTVKSHITNIYQKTGVSSRVELLTLVIYRADI